VSKPTWLPAAPTETGWTVFNWLRDGVGLGAHFLNHSLFHLVLRFCNIAVVFYSINPHELRGRCIMEKLTPEELLEKMRAANRPLSEITLDRVGGQDAIEEGYGGIAESNYCDLVHIKDRGWRWVAANGMIYDAHGL